MGGRATVGAKKSFCSIWEPKTLQPKNIRARELLVFIATILDSWQTTTPAANRALAVVKWLEASPSAVVNKMLGRAQGTHWLTVLG